MSKKAYIILLLIFCNLFAAGQDTVSKVVTLKLPKNASKLTKDEYITLTHRYFKLNNEELEKINLYEHAYKVDNILMYFNDQTTHSLSPKNLLQLQREIFGMLKRSDLITMDFSKIIIVNPIQYLVYEYHTDGEDYTINFRSDLYNAKYFTGTLRFKKRDETRAQKILDEFLIGMYFKE